jgi:deoxyribose-phosphate aldolase
MIDIYIGRFAMMLTARTFAAMFDHTILSAYAARKDFERVADECVVNGFGMIAVNSGATALCHELLKGSGVHVGAAVGFPLGATTPQAKLFETRDAIDNGADEIDYVINLTAFKDGDMALIEREMRGIVALCRERGVISKVIFETCYLNRDEIGRLCAVAREVRPDFVKTATGFGSAGATAENVALMASLVGDGIQVKASGGIRDLDACLAMIRAGARRIGSSRSVEILGEFRSRYGESGVAL